MATQPSYLLCFLGRAILLMLMCLWLTPAFGLTFHPGLLIGAYFVVIFQSSEHAKFQLARWKERQNTPQKPRSQYWLPWIGASVALLLLAEVWMQFHPSNAPKAVGVQMVFLPLGLVIDYFLSYLGMELPLRKWREHQKVNPSVKQHLSTRVAVVTKAPSVQRVGRP